MGDGVGGWGVVAPPPLFSANVATSLRVLATSISHRF